MLNALNYPPSVPMKIITVLTSVVTLIMCISCAAPRPTSTPPPSPTPERVSLNRPPTDTPRPINAPLTDIPAPTRTPAPPPGIAPTDTPAVFTPLPTPADSPAQTVGTSAGGRAIRAYRYGTGERVLLLVGGIHGGWEANTVTLMNELRAHFTDNPNAVLPGVSVVIIPALNPDGVVVGASLEGRFNANGVDLNRNWACGWQPEAVWREGPVDPGSTPFSEPETRAAAAFIDILQPAAALFYHSAADGVFAGDCPQRRPGEWRSGKLAAVYGDAAGYSSGQPFSAYPVTGTAPSWADGLGIPSADVELSSASDSQFARNLRGVQAVQCWLLTNDRLACD